MPVSSGRKRVRRSMRVTARFSYAAGARSDATFCLEFAAIHRHDPTLHAEALRDAAVAREDAGAAGHRLP